MSRRAGLTGLGIVTLVVVTAVITLVVVVVASRLHPPESAFVINDNVRITSGIFRGHSGRVVDGWLSYGGFPRKWVYYVSCDGQLARVDESVLEPAPKEIR